MTYAQRRAIARRLTRNLSRVVLIAVAAFSIVCCASVAMAGTITTRNGPDATDAIPYLIAGLGIVTAGKSVKELREMRGQLAAKIKEFRERNDDEKREWTAEDDTQFGQVTADFSQVERALRAAEAEAICSRSGLDAGFDDTDERDRHQRRRDTEGRDDDPITDETRALALAAWVRAANDLDPSERELRAARQLGLRPGRRSMSFALTPTSEYRFGGEMWQGPTGPIGRHRFEPLTEARAGLVVGTNADGGYTVPVGFLNAFEETLVQYGGPRQVCNILRTSSGNQLEMPTLDDTSNTGARLAENASIGASVDPTFGQKVLNAYKYSSKPILISAELLEDSAFNLASMIPRLLGERIGRIQGAEFTTADGSAKPNSLVNGTGVGVTAAATGAITADEIITLTHSIDPAYRVGTSLGFMFHDSVLLAIRKLKDGNGQYLWQPGMQAGQPSLLFTKPYTINQHMAGTIEASAVTMLYGDFSKATIRDSGAVRLYRLDERYRDTDQTGFVAFMRSDLEVMQAAAIKQLKQAAS